MSCRMCRTSRDELFGGIRGISVWCRIMTVVAVILCTPIALSGQPCNDADMMSTAEPQTKDSDEALEQQKKTGPRVFSEGNNGKEYVLSSGESFQVHLPENPTTGFLWTVLESSSPNLELEGKEFLPCKDRRMVGAGGTRVLIFKATSKGRAVLHLGLKRPWEKEGEFAGTYSLKLVVE